MAPATLLVPALPAKGKEEARQIQAVTPEVQTAEWAQSWWKSRHEEKLREKESLDRVDLVMIGDSIMHAWESRGKQIWDRYYEKRHALNFGFSGDRTENVLWRLRHGEVDNINPKVVVIMIGTNNAGHRRDKPEHIAMGIKAILDELKTRLPETKCLLLGIFPRGADAGDPLRKITRATNKIIQDFADGERVFYLNINDQFLDADGSLPKAIMPDRLHPNEKGYAIWAEAVEPTLKKLMRD